MSEETSDHNTASKFKPLEGWSKAEKLELYHALKNHSSSDITSLITEIPTKSRTDIEHAIQYYRSCVNNNRSKSEKPSIRNPSKYTVPVTNWANVLTDNFSFDEIQNEISEAIRIYAHFGNIPKQILTNNINFKELYLLLADAMDGKPLKKNNVYKTIIKECILGAAIFSNEFVKTNQFESIYKLLTINNFDVHTFPKPTSDEELSCLRHLMAQKKFNPFNLVENDLKNYLEVPK